MNSSAITNRTDDTTTNTAHARGSGFLRRSAAGALLATAISATAVGLAATSHADTSALVPDFASSAQAGANCKTEPWGFLGSDRRTLCDGPISADGSWRRERTIWVPAHVTSSSCGGGRSYTYCLGGHFVDQHMVSNETYPVRPDTVLPDEPGHLD